MYMSLATLAYLLIVAGWTQHRRRAVHVPLTLAGIGLDLALVVILEVSRDVIGMTVEKDWSWMQWTHIGSSLLAVLLYLPVLWLGFAILRGRNDRRTRISHRHLATMALVCRTVGFCFMWTI